MNSRERIELFLCNIKENTVIEATAGYIGIPEDAVRRDYYIVSMRSS